MRKVNVTGMRIFDEHFQTKRISPEIYLGESECVDLAIKMQREAKSLTKWSEILLDSLDTDGWEFQRKCINDRLENETMEKSTLAHLEIKLSQIDNHLEKDYGITY